MVNQNVHSSYNSTYILVNHGPSAQGTFPGQIPNSIPEKAKAMTSMAISDVSRDQKDIEGGAKSDSPRPHRQSYGRARLSARRVIAHPNMGIG